LGGGVVDAYLKHRKTTLQFDRTVLGTFLGAELGLQATIDFEGETGFGQFDCLAGHSVSVDRWRHGVRSGYSESGMADKAVLGTKKGAAHERFVRTSALRGRAGLRLPIAPLGRQAPSPPIVWSIKACVLEI
jgi:hypothetical protein